VSGRDLSEGELLALVRELAARPESWRHLVEHDPEQRRYDELVRNQHVSVWLICWSDEQDTGYHDHDLSAGAVAVVSGRIREERLALAGPPRTRVAAAGEDFTFSAADIHRVSHLPGDPAVTIHAYSPPLWRMGAYEILPGGGLRRHSMSYAEELRPIAPEDDAFGAVLEG
jgi:predicted metal-dependent enzyme (double-stranded beta helix superfamily)